MSYNSQPINIPVELQEESIDGLHILGSQVEKVTNSYVCREKELLNIISKLTQEKDQIIYINQCYQAEIESLLNKLELKNNEKVQTFTKPVEEKTEMCNIF